MYCLCFCPLLFKFNNTFYYIHYLEFNKITLENNLHCQKAASVCQVFYVNVLKTIQVPLFFHNTIILYIFESSLNHVSLFTLNNITYNIKYNNKRYVKLKIITE